jgi:hypothetical protein
MTTPNLLTSCRLPGAIPAYRAGRTERGTGRGSRSTSFDGTVRRGHLGAHLRRPPPDFGGRAEDAWEGALLAEAPPRQLRSVTAAEDWPALAALADPPDEDPSSGAVRFNHEQ